MKFLVIRRDNIGDLVCTTPLIQTLREYYPDAQIDVLANSYNAPVLNEHPAINSVYSYTKSKHRRHDQSVLSLHINRLKLLFKLRQQHYDYALIGYSSFCKFGYRLANWINPKHILGFELPIKKARNVQMRSPSGNWHEVRKTFHLLTALKIPNSPPPLNLFPKQSLQDALKKQWPNSPIIIGLQISARKPKQRWSLESFKEFMEEILKQIDCSFMLFWSPGSSDNKHHPGDDLRAHDLISLCPHLPLFPVFTNKVEDLTAGFSLCDYIVTSDGGAMHIACGLNKPILCFFAGPHYKSWYPWKTNYILINGNQTVNNISAQTAADGLVELIKSKNQPISKILQCH
ncbi:MAG: glycosyltransferase family 9 protein [Parachlamydiales bacterium]|nr:glycosyltransferase family 9 protein [Parachlamydiales bacterium]